MSGVNGVVGFRVATPDSRTLSDSQIPSVLNLVLTIDYLRARQAQQAQRSSSQSNTSAAKLQPELHPCLQKWHVIYRPFPFESLGRARRARYVSQVLTPVPGVSFAIEHGEPTTTGDVLEFFQPNQPAGVELNLVLPTDLLSVPDSRGDIVLVPTGECYDVIKERVYPLSKGSTLSITPDCDSTIVELGNGAYALTVSSQR
jgi:hypothetical protein